MNKARLGNDQGIIPNTIGKLVYSGNLDQCIFLTISIFVFSGKMKWKQTIVSDGFQSIPIVQYV